MKQKVELLKKDFYTKLAEKGLAYMYANNYDVQFDSPILHEGGKFLSTKNLPSQTKHKSNLPVLIVGAGISGLVAAYELKKANYDVILIERQQHVGGRIKTLEFKFDQDKSLGEAGAMRIPLKSRHYLTDHYAKKVFKLEYVPFYNEDPDKECFVHIRGYPEKIKVSDFSCKDNDAIQRAEKFCHAVWNGWDKNILDQRPKIRHIMQYYEKTVEEVVNHTPTRLEGESVADYTARWREWMEKWSKVSLLDFLESDQDVGVDTRTRLRPWPAEAIHGFIDINYVIRPQFSVATALTEEIGKWWTPRMYTIKGGMERLPKAFVDPIWGKHSLNNDVHYGQTVRQVKWDPISLKVTVSGTQTRTGNYFSHTGQAVIITVPLNIVRHIDFDPPLPQNVSDAIASIHYEPSTKIFLGFRKRFWEETQDFAVKDGGISKTNLPISQIVYPPKKTGDNDRGILMLYTWGKEALLFGSMTKDQAISEALREVEVVYKDMKMKSKAENVKVTEYFEIGDMQAWYDDSSAEGAFVQLYPRSYMFNLRSLLYPVKDCPIYFAGEAISFANGWIQGALESGLRAAWQFYQSHEEEEKAEQ